MKHNNFGLLGYLFWNRKC